MIKLMATVSLLTAVTLISKVAFAWELPEQNFIAPMVAPSGSQYSLQAVSSLYDGKIESTADSARHDIRIEGFGAFTFAAEVSSIRVRSQTVGKGTFRNETDDAALQNSVTSRYVVLDETAHVGAALQNELEVFGGVQLRYFSPYTEKTTAPTTSTTTTYQSGFLVSPQLGVLKRTSGWAAGFYYAMANEKKRKKTIKPSDGTVWKEESNIYMASRIGGLFGLQLAGTRFVAEGALVQAGDLSSATDEGVKIYRDYYQIYANATYPTSFAGLAFTMMHRTLSYNEQSFMDIDNIPVTQLEAALEFGGSSSKFVIGVGYVYANDGQSLEQFNAKYSITNYVARLALAAEI